MGEPSQEAVMRVLWGARAQPSRGPKPSLDLQRIAAAGVQLADGEGLSAVTMQRVAAQLGVTKMALYRYVPGKSVLVALLVEEALGAPPARSPRANWRRVLGGWTEELHGRLAHRPWLLDAMVGPRLPGPRELAWMERAVGALDGSGLTGAERMDAVALLAGHARGIAEQGRSAEGEGVEEEFGARLAPLLAEHGAEFPAVRAAFGETASDGGVDDALQFGLARILDGLAALVARRSG